MLSFSFYNITFVNRRCISVNPQPATRNKGVVLAGLGTQVAAVPEGQGPDRDSGSGWGRGRVSGLRRVLP